MYPNGSASEHIPAVIALQASIFKKCLDVSKQHNDKTEQEIVLYLNDIVSGGKEICTDMHLSWTYPSYAAILAMSKYNSNIWNKLSQDTKNKLDLLARCMLIAVAAIASDQNQDFHSGLGFNGDEGVTWSVNHRIALVAPYLFLQHFFGGGENASLILQDFNYDDYLSEIKTAGFTNIEKVWTTAKKDLNGEDFTAKDLLDYTPQNDNDFLNVTLKGDGYNPIYLGKFKGVKKPFIFRGYDYEDCALFLLIRDSFPNGLKIQTQVKIEDNYAYIVDGTISPYEGKNGMNKEFQQGRRSDAYLAGIVASMCIEMLSASLALNIIKGDLPLNFNTEDSVGRLYKMMYYGVQDTFYKLDHKYHCAEEFNTYVISYEETVSRLPQISVSREIWNSIVNQYQIPDCEDNSKIVLKSNAKGKYILSFEILRPLSFNIYLKHNNNILDINSASNSYSEGVYTFELNMDINDEVILRGSQFQEEYIQDILFEPADE